MAKSTIKLANGSVITVEGTAEEVAKVMSLYVQGHSTSEESETAKAMKSKPFKLMAKEAPKDQEVDILELVNLTKDADDFDQIEKNILDQASQVDRVLLPLFVANRENSNSSPLTSNDIYKFLKEFGINMALPNISKTLSKTAIKYVMAGSARKKGVATSYRISRKGKQHIDQIISK